MASPSDVTAAFRNQSTRLMLYLEYMEDIEGVVGRIRARPPAVPKYLSTITISGVEFTDWGDVEELFDAVGTIESVVQVELELFTYAVGDDESCPLRYVTTLLQHVHPRLESLRLEEVVLLADSEEEVDEFYAVIRNLQCLRRFFVGESFGIMLDEDLIGLDLLVEAMGTLPMIQSLDIQTRWWDQAGKSPLFTSHDTPIVTCVSSKSLQKLTLGSLHPKNDAIKEIKHILETNTLLEEVHLKFTKSIAPDSESLLVDMMKALEVNHTTRLEAFTLELAELTNLDSVLIAFATALSKCPDPVLKIFIITSKCMLRSYKVPVQEAMINMLRTNYSLERLEFDVGGREEEDDEVDNNEESSSEQCDGRIRTEEEMYARLNRRGRKLLMRSGNQLSRERWMQAFEQHANDLDALFYYLRRHPWLCQKEQQQNPHKKPPCSKRRRLLNGSFVEAGHQEEVERLKRQLHAANTEHTARARRLEDEVKRLQRENAALQAKLNQT